jgi:hypothetical protein
MAVGAAAVRSLWCCTQEEKNKKNSICFAALHCNKKISYGLFLAVAAAAAAVMEMGNGK